MTSNCKLILSKLYNLLWRSEQYGEYSQVIITVVNIAIKLNNTGFSWKATMLNFQSSSIAASSAAMLATTVGVADTLSRLRRLARLGGQNVDRLGWEQDYLSESLPLTPSPSLGHPEINRRC